MSDIKSEADRYAEASQKLSETVPQLQVLTDRFVGGTSAFHSLVQELFPLLPYDKAVMLLTSTHHLQRILLDYAKCADTIRASLVVCGDTLTTLHKMIIDVHDEVLAAVKQYKQEMAEEKFERLKDARNP